MNGTKHVNFESLSELDKTDNKNVTATNAFSKRAQDLAEAQQKIQDQIYEKNLEDQRAQEQAKEEKIRQEQKRKEEELAQKHAQEKAIKDEKERKEKEEQERVRLNK